MGTPTSTSCKDDATACGDGEVCCPLTKICVKPGADCQTPCSDSGTYCCPDAKACLKPTNPGVFCTSAADCGTKSGLVCSFWRAGTHTFSGLWKTNHPFLTLTLAVSRCG